MFDEPSEEPAEPVSDPAERAKEKVGEFRMHAELAAVFEGPRKFDFSLVPGLDAGVARDLQLRIAKLEKAKPAGSPVLPETIAAEAGALLDAFHTANLTTGDYHLHRRPGEVMILRWLAGEQVETYFQRLQAHFDAGLDGFKEDERQSQAWRNDPKTIAFLDALDKVELRMADSYLREPVRQHGLNVLTTITTDEMNIGYLSDYLMGVTPADLVGKASAPPADASERDLAWFFKNFSLRGTHEKEERIFLFTYLQKSDDSEDSW